MAAAISLVRLVFPKPTETSLLKGLHTLALPEDTWNSQMNAEIFRLYNLYEELHRPRSVIDCTLPITFLYIDSHIQGVSLGSAFSGDPPWPSRCGPRVRSPDAEHRSYYVQ